VGSAIVDGFFICFRKRTYHGQLRGGLVAESSYVPGSE
jgi:hypothetical protein